MTNNDGAPGETTRGKTTHGKMTREDKIRIATGLGMLIGFLDNSNIGTKLPTNWPLAIATALVSGLIFYAIAGLIWRKPKAGAPAAEKKNG